MKKRLAADDEPQWRQVTDSEWRRIKTSLERVGVDADAVKVPFYVPDGQEWPSYLPPLSNPKWLGPEWPLREMLPALFERSDPNNPYDYRVYQAPRPTPRELAKKQIDTIKRCNDLIAWLDNYKNYNRDTVMSKYSRIMQMFEFPELVRLASTAKDHLSALVAELERCRDKLAAMGASRGGHRRKVHITFWKELTRIFDVHVDNDVKYRNQHKINFLQACSAPYCPKEATVSALTAFVEGKARTQFSRK
jgi:hypothetical protein